MATSCLQKVATIPRLLEVGIHDPPVNLHSTVHFVAGRDSVGEEAELILAHTDSFVWVFKLNNINKRDSFAKSNELSAINRQLHEDTRRDSQNVNDVEKLCSYDLLCASQITQEDYITTVEVLNVTKGSSRLSGLTGDNTSTDILTLSGWNCIAVGFRSGMLRFYSESLQPIAQLSWNVESAVIRIRVDPCPSTTLFTNNEAENTSVKAPEQQNIDSRSKRSSELMMFSMLSDDQNLFIVPWSAMNDFLIQSKLHKAKVAAYASDGHMETLTACDMQSVSQSGLGVAKWSLLDQDTSVGVWMLPQVIEPTAFEHLQTASILGGHNATPKTNCPRFVRFVSAGCGPYLAVYDHILPNPSSALVNPLAALNSSVSRVASDYAHRLRNSFWSAASSALAGYTGQPQNQEHQKTTAEGDNENAVAKPSVRMREEKLNLRMCFSDGSRDAQHAVFSPIGNLLAIADNLGRVIIVDVDHFQVVRLFKGYRQAALAWYTATHYREHSRRNQQHAQRRSKKDRQVALFLVIHAPKRALVEVWPIMCFKGSRSKKSVPVQSSQRAAAFNVSKSSVLVSCGDGGSGSQLGGEDQVLLLDVVSANVSRLTVPFHLAFADHSSTTSRQKDQLISKQISECLSTPEIASKSGQSHGDYLSACFAQLNSASCVIECLNKVSLYEQLDVSTFSQVLHTVERFLLKREEQTEALDLDFPGSEDVLKRSSKMKSEPLVILRQLFERLSKTNKLYHSIWQLYEAQGTSYNESSEDLGTRIDASELLEQLQLLSHSTFSEDLVLNMFESNREDEEEDRADQLRSRVMDSEAFVPLNQFLPLFEAREEESELEWHLEHIGPKRNLTTQLKAMLGSFLYFPVLKGEVNSDRLIEVFSEHGLDKERSSSLLDVLLCHWLSEHKSIEANYQDSVEMLHLHSLVNWMLLINDDNEAESQSHLRSDSWQFVRSALQSTLNVSAALSAAIMLRGICISQLTTNDKNSLISGTGDRATISQHILEDSTALLRNNSGEQEEAMEGTEGTDMSQGMKSEKWLKLSYDVEAFNLLINRLEDCVLFVGLIGSSSALDASQNLPVVSVDSILQQGKGALSELMARWIIELSISCSHYKLVSTASSSSLSASSLSLNSMSRIESMPTINSLQCTMLSSLHKKLPLSLRDDYVFSQVAWLAATKWSNESSKSSKSEKGAKNLLDLSLDYLKKIPDPVMREGTAQLIWTKIIHRLVLTVWDYMNSRQMSSAEKKSLNWAAAAPLDSAESVMKFLEFSLALIENVLLSIETAGDGMSPSADMSTNLGGSSSPSFLVLSGKLGFTCEEHWMVQHQNIRQSSKGRVSLTNINSVSNHPCIPELSQRQPRCNYSLITHMRLLCTVLRLAVKLTLTVKFNFKPSDLFDHVQQHAFSQPLHSYPLTSSRDTTPELMAARQDFLQWCFMETLLVSTNSPSISSSDSTESLIESLFYCGSVLNLSDDWLLQTQIVSLYWLSIDQSASEVSQSLLSRVKDQHSLALRLMDVLAFRIERVLSSKSGSYGAVVVQARLPANLSMWLQTNSTPPWIQQRVETSMKRKLGSVDDLAKCSSLAQLIMRMLPEKHSLYSICLNCIDAISLLNDL
ncbi:rab3 GTPase-activating protein non-catalytic subunit-like isoform X2 [Convolutriloba macropyga]|uniref:rab3 GTPase-activating protein non-catalytic subunit-like isoform X2 n=1 Tax=Convolutriloba macropyga TaxID=536237 RepID=UPI003F51C1E8